ncbi:hypothetical protein G6F57_016087 [Rhizopus arrhizus]|nr:hypothetical protein G6F57_016087 [Rhizopus arrhizus]
MRWRETCRLDQFHRLVLVFHAARDQARVDLHAAADRVAAIAHRVGGLVDGDTAHEQWIEGNVDVTADRIHAKDGLAILQDLNPVAAETADDRGARVRSERTVLHAGDMLEQAAQGAVLRLWIVDGDPAVDSRGLRGLDLKRGKGGFVRGVGGVDGEQNGGSKQMATHDTLRENSVKCYNVTICIDKGRMGLASGTGDESGSHMRMADVRSSVGDSMHALTLADLDRLGRRSGFRYRLPEPAAITAEPYVVEGRVEQRCLRPGLTLALSDVVAHQAFEAISEVPPAAGADRNAPGRGREDTGRCGAHDRDPPRGAAHAQPECLAGRIGAAG